MSELLAERDKEDAEVELQDFTKWLEDTSSFITASFIKKNFNIPTNTNKPIPDELFEVLRELYCDVLVALEQNVEQATIAYENILSSTYGE